MARRRRSRSSLALRSVAALVFLAIAFAYVHPLRSYLDARAKVAARRAEVKELARKKRELSERAALAGTSAFVEREARRLGLVKPGERLFIVKGLRDWKKSGVR